MRNLITICLVLGILIPGLAQKKRTKRTNDKPAAGSTTVNPIYPQKVYEPKKKKQAKGPTYESQNQFYERVDELNETRVDNERRSKMKRYKDPMYFGHKRPPKKRPVGKMKFCKVCGIRH